MIDILDWTEMDWIEQANAGGFGSEQGFGISVGVLFRMENSANGMFFEQHTTSINLFGVEHIRHRWRWQVSSSKSCFAADEFITKIKA